MKKIFNWITSHLLFLVTLFLLAFIPLYPKLPLLDIRNTWVYIRAEDFVVLSVIVIWAVHLIKKKITLRTPLTLPILIFWLVGAIATIHGIILIFPKTANIFPNVAFLSFLRHIEYLSLFFVAFSGMRDKRFLKIVIWVIITTLLGVILYGFGQRYLGFPAYLTSNEEFAKGIPIQLSLLSRVPSTFAGHYDLAAYLVLVVPIIISLIFGFKNWLIKIFLAVLTILGFILMLMTVSRVSFFVLLISSLLVLFFHKRRFILYSIPVLGVLAFLFFATQSSLLARFGNTIREVNVLVDAKTGEAIGHVNYVPKEYFNNKIITEQVVKDRGELDSALSGGLVDGKSASPSARYPLEFLPPEVPLVVDTNISTGENLPQGTGYINLSLSPVTQKLGDFFYELTSKEGSTESAEVLIIHGDFLIKRAAAYDLSFTTRFQGEWPNAVRAFERNIFLGSGYGSVSLAVDNNFLRILGETGLLGSASFAAIFLSFAIYVKKVLPKSKSRLLRSFVLGFAAGVIGLFLNATLIDVFEASKIAFVLWLLVGVVLGALSLYQTQEINLVRELMRVVTSKYAIVIYLFILTFIIFSPMANNYFVGDDFTWFRWAADCNLDSTARECPKTITRISQYFTQADGFFYRPGTKTYFLSMYSIFWLNQVVFHSVSVFAHFIVAALFFLLANKVFKEKFLAALGSLLFIVMSGYAEIVLWISGTGHLFNAAFILAGLLLFIEWEERRKIYYFIGSLIFIFLSMLFHELGVVTPLLIILYKSMKEGVFKPLKLLKNIYYLGTFAPVALYLVMRLTAQSHWGGGDYSYNLIKLPFNLAGNAIGYIFLTFLGPLSMPLYQTIRNAARENVGVVVLAAIILISLAFFLYRILVKRMDVYDKKIIIFGLSFFIISLLPFIALGNITSRYSYLASLGLILIFVYYIKKIYVYLKFYGRDIALISTALIVSVFALLHIIQIQKLHDDWKTAGNMAKRFFVAIDSLYSESWSEKGTELHFVNVPIKHADAWVFPVGLRDAVWLTFQNDDLKVLIHNNLKEALQIAGTSTNKWVLEFDAEGNVSEVFRVKDAIPPNPIN